MPTKAQEQAVVPNGDYRGIIMAAAERYQDFHDGMGKQARIVLVIQPKWDGAPKGAEVLPLQASFTPSLNGLSGYSAFLKQLGIHPKNGETFDEATLEGRELMFRVERNEAGFANIVKNTIRAAK